MEKLNKSDLTVLLAAITVSSGVLVSSGQPAMAEGKTTGMTIAEKGTNLADDDKKADETKKEEGTAKKKGPGKNSKARGGCNYPCGCHYGVTSKKHKGDAKAADKKADDASKDAEKK